MKKRIISIILSLALCVSAFCSMSATSVSAANKQNDYVVFKQTMGVNEQINFGVAHGLEYSKYAYVNTSNGVMFPQYKSGAELKVPSNKVLRVPLRPKTTGTAQIFVGTDNTIDSVCNIIYVTVKNAPTSVKINQSSLTLGKGETYSVSENTNSGSYASSDNLKWTTSNSNIAKVYKLTGNKANIFAKGTGTAYVKVTTYNNKVGTCKVTVKNAPSKVYLSKSSITLKKGSSYVISESTNSGSYAKSFTWSSSNSKVATVTKGSGNKAIIKAVGKGTAYITVKTYNGKTAKCKVVVK